jgi:hypothetical protein
VTQAISDFDERGKESGVTWKDYPFKREYPERGMNSAQYQDAENKWSQLLRSTTQR